MTISKEYQLVQVIPAMYTSGKSGWAVSFIVYFAFFGYVVIGIISQEKSMVNLVPFFILFVIFYSIYLNVKNNKPRMIISIQDNELYITSNGATLWYKLLSEITDIEVIEPIKNYF